VPSNAIKQIAYLFGAGATHAELTNLNPDLIEEKRGLLISNVSSRVIDLARQNKSYLKNVESVSGIKGSLNIELLISLIEHSKVHRWNAKTFRLRKLVEDDIKGILSPSQTKRFFLHKALLELHTHKSTKLQEELVGLISLNYDEVLDQAYKVIFRKDPNYCFSFVDHEPFDERVPLLKLHGSFNWDKKKIHGRYRTVEIIPLGATKSYLHVPYGFIWTRALEILIRCDVLRVIGCSLSPNDGHLIDLLFKAHLERSKPFEIQIVGPDEIGGVVKNNYGFFPEIKTLLELEGSLIPERNPPNPFKTWLKYKSIAMLGQTTAGQKIHLSKVIA